MRLAENKLRDIIERVHWIGENVIAPWADVVDREARFPHEAFSALKDEKLLSCYVPLEYGGMGFSIADLSQVCEVIAKYCASTAMIFAMHQIQVACIVHNALPSDFFRRYVRSIVEKQYLLASATTEVGTGGDVRSSICAINLTNGIFSLEKQAPVVSYGESADAFLVTCRRHPEALPNDQVLVLVVRGHCSLVATSGWDTLGFRGTCSKGFILTASGNEEQIFPVPYSVVHSYTMHPFSHCVWSSLWLGIAVDAVSQARAFVRSEAKKDASKSPSALRLAEVDTKLFLMRNGVQKTVDQYLSLLEKNDYRELSNFAFVVLVNNLKLTSSSLIVDIVINAMQICGISGYRNDSKFTISRLLRDALGAALMVNNERILNQNSMMQIIL